LIAAGIQALRRFAPAPGYLLSRLRRWLTSCSVAFSGLALNTAGIQAPRRFAPAPGYLLSRLRRGQR